MPAFLFVDAKTGAGGATNAAFRYVNATPQQIGNTFGADFISPDSISAPRNGLIQFQGELYAMVRDGIFQKDDPTSMTGAWSSALVFTSTDASDVRTTGLYPMEIAGVQNLVGVFGSGSDTTWKWVKFDGTTWTQGGGVAIGLSIQRIHDVVVWNGVLYWVGSAGGTATVTSFDPGSDSFSSSTPFGASSVYNIHCFCIYQGRLFMLDSITGDAYLTEFVGGVWVNAYGMTFLNNAGFSQANTKWCLFTDGTNMYAFVMRDNTAGWKAYEFDSSLVLTEITNTVLPAALKSPIDGGSFPNLPSGPRCVVCYDVDSVPGSTSIYLYFAVNSNTGTALTMFQWNGNAALLTSVDTGGDAWHSPPSGYSNHGERIWTAGELDIRITSRMSVLGGEQIFFTCYGGGTGRKMKLYYSVDGEPLLTEAALIGPVTGGSATLNTGMNQVEDIDADGSTIYSIIWDAPTDGITFGQRVNRAPQVFV